MERGRDVMKKLDIVGKMKGVKFDKGTAYTIGALLLSAGAAVLSGMKQQTDVKKEYDAVIDRIVDEKVTKALKNK